MQIKVARKSDVSVVIADGRIDFQGLRPQGNQEAEVWRALNIPPPSCSLLTVPALVP